ncbi:MAG: heparinase [Gammaproteobacteria bacterium]|nr:heparinase [Gammaproteobacteria bacterium]
MSSLGTLWRTIRHLKFNQIAGRIVFRLKRPSPCDAPAPRRRAWCGRWIRPAARRPSLCGPLHFCFLGVDHELDQVGWSGSGVEKLWRYNQHYFDDLNASGASDRREWHSGLIARWLSDNVATQGDGWEPYPTSLRMINWIKASASGFDLSFDAWQNLAVQARYLSERLEWHLLGNHLFVNAKALVFAGLAFEGAEASRWLSTGLGILREQLPEQVLEDGGHFERSPMYHALALEDLLDLINVANASGVTEVGQETVRWRRTAGRMLFWLRSMTHPDGRLGRFNDTADGVAPSNVELERYASALGVEGGEVPRGRVTHLAASGYARVDWCDALALLDLAPVGPDYLPGHAHADTLSFELSLHGRLLVVNSGTSCYGLGERRSYERGTAAHSTVEVDGQNSSEVWGGFRVGRRARPLGVSLSGDPRGAGQIRASHDGYRWLPGKPLHSRTWNFISGGLEVRDEVSDASKPALARYHLAPGISLQSDSPDLWLVRYGGETLARVSVVGGECFEETSSFAPEFGRVHAARCLVVRLRDGHALTRWAWRDLLSSA